MSMSSRELRNHLGRFATGITVVTTRTDEGAALGLTANSFSSVSLDPPLVLWSLQNSSEVFPHFSGARRYAINILSQEQEPLSNHYARRGDHLLVPEHCLPQDDGSPLLRDALVSFDCALEKTYPGGDHIIILGRVVNVVSRSDGEPLLYYGGAYCALG
jgi:flavin reductase (DIM6/NTAB) family NADH-FMN oxidoreductase RutF